jgi:hypothetical protein
MPPAAGPITMAELELRLERAAQAETFGLNELELLAARPNAEPVFGEALFEVRRQAMALAMAARVARALRARPELALGLGIPTETAVS